MKKRITFFFVGMLFMAIGGVNAQTILTITGGTNRDIPSGDNPTSGIVQFKDNGFRSSIGGTAWAETWTSGTHTFVVELENDNNEDCTLTLAAFDEEITNWYADNSWIEAHQVAIASISVPSSKTLTLEVSQNYAAVYLYASGYKKVNIKSITRTIGGVAPVVNAPTVNPASGTYDGELNVTITKGENNTKVVYSVSGATTGDVTNAEFTESSKTLNLTGTGTITVTATGYEGEEASTVVTNTYTYDSNIPSGVTTVWSGNQEFSDNWGQNVQINKSNFANLEVGDYIYLNVATPHDAVPNIGFRDDWSDGTFKTYTETSGGNAAYGNMAADEPYWWVKITDETLLNLFKNGTPRIQGQNFTLTSVEIHKAKSISENSDNSITKYTDMIVNLERSFVKDMWNTVCLPFAPTAEQANALFGTGYQLAAFTGVSGTTMEFSTIDISGFEAGKPYLVKPTQDLSSPVTLFDVDLTATNGKTVTFGDYSFKGTFVSKSFDASERSSVRFVGSGNKLLTPNDDSSMKALRCYFVVPAESAARSFTIDGMDDSTTSISGMSEATTTNYIYDLSGRQVVNPVKGLYIVNGRKVVIK